MAVVADRVIVELEAKLGKYEANVLRAEQKFDKAMSGIQRSSKATEATVSLASRGMASALAGISVIALAKKFLEIADASKKLDAQMRLATSSFGTFTQAQKDVRDIASRTRSDLESTAQLYGNFVRNGRELGITQAEAARATETVAKAFKISGAGAAESAQSIRQLVQALQSGVLRGDEFNTMMEGAPRLARLLAESLGVTVGQLRALAEDGKLTADKLTRAFTNAKFTKGLDDEFRQLPVTFEEAMGQVYNAAQITFGAFDQGGEFSKALSEFITGGASDFKSLETAARQFGLETRATIEGLADVFNPLMEAGSAVFEALGLQADDLGMSIRDVIRNSLRDIDSLINIGIDGLNRIRGAGNAAANTLTEAQRRAGADKYWQGDTGGKVATTPLIQRSNLLGAYDKGVSSTQTRLTMSRIMGTSPLAEFGSGNTGNVPRATTGGTTKKGKSRKGMSAEDIEARGEQEISRLVTEELRARLDLATSVEDRAQIQREILEEERKARVAEINSDKKLTAPQRAAQLAAIDRLYGARSTGQNDITVSAAGLYEQGQRKEIEKERNKLAIEALADERETLEAEAGIIESRIARRDAELRILALLEEEEKSRLEAQIAAGEIADATVARAQLERRQSARRTDTSRDYESPLQGYARRLNRTPDQISDQVEEYVIDELDAVQQGIANALSDAIGTKDPLINGLINLLIQQVIMKPLAEALAGIGGGGGGIGGIAIGLISSVFGGLFADGGTPPMGKVSIVGERGPELFVPKQAGVIVPNHALKGGGNTTVVQQTFVLDNRGGITTPELIDYINQTARTEALGAGRAAYSQSMKDAPAAISTRNRYGV